jgi:hypothetical protein
MVRREYPEFGIFMGGDIQNQVSSHALICGKGI